MNRQALRRSIRISRKARLGLIATASPSANPVTPSPMLKDAARCLVPENDRFAHADRSDAAVGHVVQVRPADPGGGDAKKDFALAGGGHIVGFDAEVLFAIEAADAGLHVCLAQFVRMEGSQVASGGK